MNVREMQEAASLVGQIVGTSVENAVILQKRIQHLKSGLQIIARTGHLLSSHDMVRLAKSVLEDYEKMP